MAKSSSFKLYLAISISLAFISLVHAIIDGVDTTVAKYNFMSTVRNNGRFVCCGVLVDIRVVITTADCASGLTDLTKVIVRNGQTVLNNSNEGIRRAISAIFIATGYVKDTGKMNFAALKLKDDMVGVNIGVVDLCTTPPPAMAAYKVLGWGLRKQTYANPSQTLAEADLKLYPKDQCVGLYNTKVNADDETMCLWSGATQIPAKFDEGGAVTTNNELVGLTLFGLSSDGTKPWVFTNVCNTPVYDEMQALITKANA